MDYKYWITEKCEEIAVLEHKAFFAELDNNTQEQVFKKAESEFGAHSSAQTEALYDAARECGQL